MVQRSQCQDSGLGLGLTLTVNLITTPILTNPNLDHDHAREPNPISNHNPNRRPNGYCNSNFNHNLSPSHNPNKYNTRAVDMGENAGLVELIN